MNKTDKIKVKKLEQAISEYMASGKSISDFIKESVFKDYTEGGDEKLEEIATQYFLDHLK